MITRVINADREAIVRLKIRGSQGEEEITTVVDTGFNGFLTLPAELIAHLGCPFISRGHVILADGRMEEVDIVETIVDWDGQELAVETDTADSEPLIGMSLMYGYELVMPVLDGASFTLRRIIAP